MAKAKAKKQQRQRAATGDSFNVAGLNSLLKKVHLGGVIGECLLTIRNGVGNIEAIDPTDCVFVRVSEKICEDSDNFELGIIEMATMIKLLDTIQEDEVDFKVVDEQIVFKIKGRGQAKFTLAEPNLISTSVEGDADYAAVKDGSPHEIEITKKHVDDFCYFMGLFSSGSTIIESKKNKITIGGGPNDEKSFSVSFGKGKDIPDFQISIYGELLKSVLGELDWSEGAEIPTLNIGEDNPAFIQQGEFSWALTPEDEEE